MDIIIEVLVELLLEGSISLGTSKRVPKVIRYPLIVLIALLFGIVIIGLFAIGLSLWHKSIYAALLLLAASLALLIGCGYQLKKAYIAKRDKLSGE